MIINKKFINYGGYSGHRMSSTIQLSNETKKLIGTFGSKEESYEDIIKKLYGIAVKTQFRDFLMSSENTISLQEARKRHVKRW